MIALKVRKVGNSCGVTLPKEVLAKLKATEGDTLVLTEMVGGYQLAVATEDLSEEMRAFEEGRRRYRNALRELAK
ncbi:MAG: AbrB/MazE/SpoVT family DNA-binding domain-containing protein [Alphaproteobacteria bacterium]|nr:AbrB/MazE/SpoVT family DNA-binding domain-containing protein [Alphaproteobacteria bacterium]